MLNTPEIDNGYNVEVCTQEIVSVKSSVNVCLYVYIRRDMRTIVI